jgi:cardiolipin synthase
MVRLGSSVRAAVTRRRNLGPAEANIMVVAGALLLTVVLLAVFFPAFVIIPVAVFSAWLAISFFVQAYRLRYPKRKRQ